MLERITCAFMPLVLITRFVFFPVAPVSDGEDFKQSLTHAAPSSSLAVICTAFLAEAFRLVPSFDR